MEAGGRVEGRDGGREGREGSEVRREVRHCDRLGEGRGQRAGRDAWDSVRRSVVQRVGPGGDGVEGGYGVEG